MNLSLNEQTINKFEYQLALEGLTWKEISERANVSDFTANTKHKRPVKDVEKFEALQEALRFKPELLYQEEADAFKFIRDNWNEATGKEIKTLIESSTFSENELVSLVGGSRGTYRRWYAARVKPRHTILAKLLRLINIQPSHFMPLVDTNKNTEVSIEETKEVSVNGREFYATLVEEAIKDSGLPFGQFCKKFDFTQNSVLSWRRGSKPQNLIDRMKLGNLLGLDLTIFFEDLTFSENNIESEFLLSETSFGTFIQKERLRLNLTRKQFAEKLKITEKMLQRIESEADFVVSYSNLRKISDGMSLSYSELARAYFGELPDKTFQERLAKYRKYSLISVQEITDALGFENSNVYRNYEDLVVPSREEGRFKAISEALNIPERALMAKSGHNFISWLKNEMKTENLTVENLSKTSNISERDLSYLLETDSLPDTFEEVKALAKNFPKGMTGNAAVRALALTN